jgi:hypothetical protein
MIADPFLPGDCSKPATVVCCTTKLKLSLALLFVVALLLAAPFWIPWLYWDVSPGSTFVSLDPSLDISNPSIFNASTFVVPKVIHHRWNDEIVPERWQPVLDRCKALHPDYQFILWTEKSGRELLQRSFPEFLPTYDKYPYTIQQADIIRYFFLYEYGGIYLDLDVECKRRLDYLRQYDVVLPKTWPIGLSMDVLIAAPKQPFYKQVQEALPWWAHTWGSKYPTVMFSTGPMFLTWQAMLYPDRKGLSILPVPLYGKWTHSAVAFFEHYYASMWHDDDAKLALGVWRAKKPILVLLLVGIVLKLWHIYLKRARRCWAQRSSVQFAPQEVELDDTCICKTV